jgi:hypothetical protein
MNLVAVLVGGLGIYATEFRVIGPDGRELARKPGPDVAFTTQIKRFNLTIPVAAITAEPIVTAPGTYTIDLFVRDTRVASTPIEIAVLPGAPPWLGLTVPPQKPTT